MSELPSGEIGNIDTKGIDRKKEGTTSQGFGRGKSNRTTRAVITAEGDPILFERAGDYNNMFQRERGNSTVHSLFEVIDILPSTHNERLNESQKLITYE